MNYCLACRRFSAVGPICTNCGSSFGGRLCRGKKRHLNPPGAQFCGQCGSTDLYEAASYIPFGCLGRILVVVGFLGTAVWGGGWLLHRSGDLFHSLTGFRSPLVWAIERSAHVLIILFVFYFLSLVLPGDTGRQFRALVSKLCFEAVRFLLQGMFGAARGIGRVFNRL